MTQYFFVLIRIFFHTYQFKITRLINVDIRKAKHFIIFRGTSFTKSQLYFHYVTYYRNYVSTKKHRLKRRVFEFKGSVKTLSLAGKLNYFHHHFQFQH